MTLPHRRFLLLSLLCAALASLPFLPGLPGGFVFDDAYNIVQNNGVHLQSLAPDAVLAAAFGAQPGSATRVLPMLSFALDYFRGNGPDPATFKATNIAIHALTALALAWFLRSLLLSAGIERARAQLAASVLALAWAIHPLQVSSVLYVVQRMQTLATLFLVLALWAYLLARQAQMENRPGRAGWLLSGLLWAIAFSCKEDAIVFPAYALALELTVLRFRAHNSGLSKKLQRGYLVASSLGAALFLLVVVPSFWSWDVYPTRDFTTYERLLTQGRVLCMYLWQILLPLPSHLPFYYDWLQPSRSLLQPWTTLPALFLLTALLTMAVYLRHRRPLFALGILWFFAGHFVTANVIGLELAFEHRNHFPLIGITLAVADLLAVASTRLKLRPLLAVSACAMALPALASTTVIRARSWNSALAQAQTSTRLAPASARAWNSLCVEWFDLGGGAKPENPNLDKAISACNKGAEVGTDSIKSLTNIIAFKAIQGTLAQPDWDRYLQRLRHVTMTPDNASAIWVILNKARDGLPMDGNQILEAIDIINHRTKLKPIESAAMGYFILGHTQKPDRAYLYFAQAVQTTKDHSFATGLIEDLRKEGHPDWADRLQGLPPPAAPAP